MIANSSSFTLRLLLLAFFSWQNNPDSMIKVYICRFNAIAHRSPLLVNLASSYKDSLTRLFIWCDYSYGHISLDLLLSILHWTKFFQVCEISYIIYVQSTIGFLRIFSWRIACHFSFCLQSQQVFPASHKYAFYHLLLWFMHQTHMLWLKR